MSTPQIRIKTERFRAIASADIIINGITVVTGENGCGKSTLSKLLYYLYKTASNYEALVIEELRANLRDIERFLEILVSDLHSISKQRNTREEFQELRDLQKNTEHIDEEQLEKWKSFIQKIANNYYSQPSLFKENVALNPRLSNRLKFIIRDVLNEKDISKENDRLPFQRVIEVLEQQYKEAFEKVKSRPTSLFLEALINVFSDGDLLKKFEVFEFDDQIVSIDKKSLSIPYAVQNVIYIETPMMIGMDYTEIEYWDDLNKILHKKGKASYSWLSQTISNEIINGEVSLDDNALTSNDFSFKRSDGSIYNLLDCATGVKSFAILQLLLKSGSLTDKTLLIMDEPESHLHPQWIIEYARLIVLLNKEIGVKFFIASHNPDMVSAIKYISEKEGIDKDLNFYLAEKTETPYIYVYNHLFTDIDPIFKSFNVAIDRINQYGIQ